MIKTTLITTCLLVVVALTGCESSPKKPKEEVRTNYYDSGIIKEKSTSIGLLRTVEAYDENGTLTQITKYKGNDITSIKELFPSGTPKKKTSYWTPLDLLSMAQEVKGKTTVEYYPNGKPFFKLRETPNGTVTRTSYKEDGEILIRRRTLRNGKKSGLQYDGFFGWVAQSGVCGIQYSATNYTGSRLISYYDKKIGFIADDQSILMVMPYKQDDSINILITVEEFDENICVPDHEETPITIRSLESRPLIGDGFKNINAALSCVENDKKGVALAFSISQPSEVAKFYGNMKQKQMFQNDTLAMEASVSGYGVKSDLPQFRGRTIRLDIPTINFVETYDAIEIDD